ncbi:hypothetical protein HSB1_06800 [Halogranum salarium B-1]|uniref:Uncharacterized protein n=1 Tax=Halogranum salarium B-1 TaxID=1210908 RepID=J3EXW6_9EURY|nr:hypothetical protein HSB1_06800 [Halogranum salarium B-1]
MKPKSPSRATTNLSSSRWVTARANCLERMPPSYNALSAPH